MISLRERTSWSVLIPATPQARYPRIDPRATRLRSVHWDTPSTAAASLTDSHSSDGVTAPC